jgi:predicted ribosomally synthesized peptide with nif11-like leader
MSVDSALAYINRMHTDEEFRARMTLLSDDEEASWAALRDEGFEFTLSEFKRGQEAYCRQNDLIEKDHD